MATPKTTLWKRDPHTAAKHEILRAYLQAWFPILGRHHRRIVYLDGFAGPGEYEDNIPGSPLLALDVALDQQVHLRHEVVFYFIEAKKDRAEHLKRLVEARLEDGLPEKFKVGVRHGEFANEVRVLLDDLDAKGLSMAPTFAFIDPFGWKGLPMTLVHRLLSHDRTEAFINFAVDPVNRFITHPNAEINAQMLELFGTEEVITTHAAGSGYDALRELYGEQLRQAARYVRFFTMKDTDDRDIYDLFFATKHALGLEKMKEAMWRADPDGNYRFSDATDPNQEVLFNEMEFVPKRLHSLMMKVFADQTAVLVSTVEDWALSESPYLRKHAKDALKYGEASGALTIQPVKLDGSKRRKGYYPSDALVDFVPAEPPAPSSLVPTQPTFFD